MKLQSNVAHCSWVVHARFPSTQPLFWNQERRRGEEWKSLLISGLTMWEGTRVSWLLESFWNSVRRRWLGEEKWEDFVCALRPYTKPTWLWYCLWSSFQLFWTDLGLIPTLWKSVSSQKSYQLSVEHLSLRTEILIHVCTLMSAEVYIYWHVHTRCSQPACILIGLCSCRISYRFWKPPYSRGCWCPACIFSACLSLPVTSVDSFQHTGHFLPHVHMALFSGAPEACFRAGRGNHSMQES